MPLENYILILRNTIVIGGWNTWLTHWGRDKIAPIFETFFKCIFLNKTVWYSIKISLKSVPKCPINHIPPLIKIMAWRRSGDKPLSEPMMARLPTHICVTRPQWLTFNTYLHLCLLCALLNCIRFQIYQSPGNCVGIWGFFVEHK